ncbi:phage head spike fiber domain-containing protein [Methylosinus sp. LW4]|uniref:phage head spike fiber domain-containing protein n=1 Tax=Methylosinus sp. LW4 TaxID=136993 RepID=UPI0003AA5B6E|nr:hypothetical protein [Methylosinus sp. LW4]
MLGIDLSLTSAGVALSQGVPAAPFGPADADLVLNFATQQYWARGAGFVAFSDLFTFSRASAETVTDANGAVSYVANDVPAISSAGYGSTWPAATNLLLHSDDLSTSPWSTFSSGTGSVARVAAAGVAPDGTTTAAKITVNRSNTTSYAEAYQQFTGTVAVYTASIWVKAFSAADKGGQIALAIYDGTNTTATLVILSGAWQRVSVSATMVASASCQIVVGYTPALGSGASSVSFLAWGAQVELGAAATPYIPSSASQGARAAVSCAPKAQLASMLSGAAGSVSLITGSGRRSTAATLLKANGVSLLGVSAANLATTAAGATLNSSNVGAWAYQNNVGLAWDGAGGVIALNGTVAGDTQSRSPQAPFAFAEQWGGGIDALVAWKKKKSSPQFGAVMSPGFIPTGTSHDFTSPNPIWPTTASVPPFRDFGNFSPYASNPITAANTGAYNSNGVGNPYARENAKIGSTYFALTQAAPSSANNWINLALYTSTNPPLSWTPAASNPAITHSAGQWDDNYLLHPDIIPSPQGDGTLWAYYSACSSAGPTTGAWGIGLIKSSADGQTWTKYGLVIGPSANASNPGLPTVIKIGSTYYLYCCDNGNVSTKIVYFTSPDGVTWTYGGVALGAPSANQWDRYRSGIIDPWISKNKHGFYEMTYSAIFGFTEHASGQEIGYAVSADGVNWTYYNNGPLFYGHGIYYTGNVSLFEVPGVGEYYLYTDDSGAGSAYGAAKTAPDF